MARCSNWPAELVRFVTEHEHKPFSWTRNNCALFACNWVKRLTGKDPAKGLRGKCRSAASVARIVAAEGGLLALASKRCAAHGWSPVPYKLAQRGDVVLAQLPTVGLTLGICCGQRAAFPGKAGVVWQPMSTALVAWRIN